MGLPCVGWSHSSWVGDFDAGGKGLSKDGFLSFCVTPFADYWCLPKAYSYQGHFCWLLIQVGIFFIVDKRHFVVDSTLRLSPILDSSSNHNLSSFHFSSMLPLVVPCVYLNRWPFDLSLCCQQFLHGDLVFCSYLYEWGACPYSSFQCSSQCIYEILNLRLPCHASKSLPSKSRKAKKNTRIVERSSKSGVLSQRSRRQPSNPSHINMH